MTAPASLHDAHDRLSEACALLDEWHAKETGVQSGRSYVGAGHAAVGAIDATLRALHTARAALVSELRRDEDERAVRVDRMLAEGRELLARLRTEPLEYEREDPETGRPLPAGVDGWRPGGAR